jgi:hypothetical protein
MNVVASSEWIQVANHTFFDITCDLPCDKGIIIGLRSKSLYTNITTWL